MNLDLVLKYLEAPLVERAWLDISGALLSESDEFFGFDIREQTVFY